MHPCLCLKNQNYGLRFCQKTVCTSTKKSPMARLNNQPRHPPISSQVQVTRCMTELSELYSVHPCLCLKNRNHGLRLCQNTVRTCKKKCPVVRLNNQHHSPISSQVQVMRFYYWAKRALLVHFSSSFTYVLPRKPAWASTLHFEQDRGAETFHIVMGSEEFGMGWRNGWDQGLCAMSRMRSRKNTISWKSFSLNTDRNLLPFPPWLLKPPCWAPRWPNSDVRHLSRESYLVMSRRRMIPGTSSVRHPMIWLGFSCCCKWPI